MTDYSKLAPIVKKAFKAFEDETAKKQAEMEEAYLAEVAKDEASAAKLLNDFNHKVINEAVALAEDLMNELFTIRTADIEAAVVFKNNKSKD